MKQNSLVVLFMLMTIVVGCSLLRDRKGPALEPVSPPPISDSRIASGLQPEEELLLSIDQSLRYFEKVPADKELLYGDLSVSVERVKQTLQDLAKKVRRYGLQQQLFDDLMREYQFFASPAGTVTGYYEAELNGSRQRTERFRYPLYRNPEDTVTVRLNDFPMMKEVKGSPDNLIGRFDQVRSVGPYFSRDEIDRESRLAGRNLELAWVDDPVKLFFLHIQGSGILSLGDGTTMRVNYAGKNGHPYRPIGRYLVEQGLLQLGEVSKQSIERILRSYPAHSDEIFRSNPSYVFFREVKEGPLGCLGVPVTSFRSIATDSALLPKGAPAFLKTEIPRVTEMGEITGWRQFFQIVLNQDTGGAIKGAGRVDLFTGRGRLAEAVAGRMNREGQLYFFLQ